MAFTTNLSALQIKRSFGECNQEEKRYNSIFKFLLLFIIFIYQINDKKGLLKVLVGALVGALSKTKQFQKNQTMIQM
jgi:hypothetical protein